MELQKPSMGRIVHVQDEDGQVMPAIIVKVWNETCVNVHAFHPDGQVKYLTSVVQGPGQNPRRGPTSWFWPPRV